MRFIKAAENLFGLPQGFTRVEYLKSDGLSLMYITPDLSYFPDFEVGVKCDSNSDRNATLGVDGNNMLERSSASNPYWTLHASGTTFMSNVGVGTYADAKYKDGVFSVNGVTVGTKENTFQSGTLCLFKPHAGNNNLYKMSIYFFKAWDSNGTLVRDFIPCIDPLGIPCMYDLVGKKPYYNQGTGTFAVGRQIIPVEYLESTGIQWLKTDYTLTANTKIDVLFSPNQQTTANLWVIGSYVASNKLTGVRITGETTIDCYINTVVSKTVSGSNIGNRYQAVLDGKWTVNGSEGTAVTVSAGLSPLTLFGWNASQTANTYSISGLCSTKIYHCKILDNGVLVRDFIPCKDENNVGFMFDKLSGTVYLNAGTGAFSVGENKYKMKLRLIKDNKLPAGYTQVEYLESSGTQYIDTGINPENANTHQVDIETNFAILTPTSDQYIGIFGAAVPRFGFYTRYNNMCFGYYVAFDNLHEIEYGKKYNLKYSVTKSNQSATLDGVNVWSATRGESLQNTYTIGLFCRNYSTPQWRNNARIYNLTIAIDGTLVRNFIPALDPTGTPCMYDLVSRTPFYNAGTGTFTTGKPVLPIVRFPVDPVPVGYKTVNYLESTGTQYIDTGFIANQDTRIVADFSYTKNPVYTGFVFGSGYSSTDRAFELYPWGDTWDSPYGNTTIRLYNGTFLGGRIHADKNKNNIVITYANGTTQEGSASYTEFTTTDRKALLFAINRGTVYLSDCVQMYSCEIYDNGSLIRNFIPVIRRIDKVAGMWDTVTKQFYGNSGTGNFNYG